MDRVFFFRHMSPAFLLNFIDPAGSQVESVSIRSESAQALPSELVTVLVTDPGMT